MYWAVSNFLQPILNELLVILIVKMNHERSERMFYPSVDITRKDAGLHVSESSRSYTGSVSERKNFYVRFNGPSVSICGNVSIFSF